MGKRGNHEGTIYHRKDGKWEAKVTIGYNDDGKPKRLTKYFKTRQEAAAWLAEVQTAQHTGTLVEPNKVTLGEWLDGWFFTYQKPHIEAKTYDLQEYLIRVHIKPGLGDKVLVKLRPVDLQTFYAAKLQGWRLDGKSGGLASQTVIHMHNILHKALDQAVKEGLLVRNVAEATSPPKLVKTVQMRTMTKDEALHFLRETRADRLYPAFLLDIGTGLRRGELLALRWQDVDLDAGTIQVRQQLQRVKGGAEKSRLVITEPKTKLSRRMVPISATVVKALRAHKARQNENRLFLGTTYAQGDLVFCTAAGRPLEPRTVKRSFDRLLKKVGLEHMTIHGLRHTFATAMLTAGVHPKIVQELLGHSRIATAQDTYSHVMPGLKMQAVSHIEDFLTEEPPAQADDKKTATLVGGPPVVVVELS